MSVTYISRTKEFSLAMQKRADALVKKTAFDLEANAKIEAPVATGFLRNSIQTAVTGPLAAEVTVGAEYGIYVNNGTSRRAANPFFDRATALAAQKFEEGFRKLFG